MRFLFIAALLTLFGSTAFAQDSESKKLSDDEIAKVLIQQSIDAYSGNCPCPYNTTSNGSRCGKRSAYSRPGGEEPLCFRRDVTDDMIEQYRSTHE